MTLFCSVWRALCLQSGKQTCGKEWSGALWLTAEQFTHLEWGFACRNMARITPGYPPVQQSCCPLATWVPSAVGPTSHHLCRLGQVTQPLFVLSSPMGNNTWYRSFKIVRINISKALRIGLAYTKCYFARVPVCVCACRTRSSHELSISFAPGHSF